MYERATAHRSHYWTASRSSRVVKRRMKFGKLKKTGSLFSTKKKRKNVNPNVWHSGRNSAVCTSVHLAKLPEPPIVWFNKQPSCPHGNNNILSKLASVATTMKKLVDQNKASPLVWWQILPQSNVFSFWSSRESFFFGAELVINHNWPHDNPFRCEQNIYLPTWWDGEKDECKEEEKTNPWCKVSEDFFGGCGYECVCSRWCLRRVCVSGARFWKPFWWVEWCRVLRVVSYASLRQVTYVKQGHSYLLLENTI